jgi:hypothetical protein
MGEFRLALLPILELTNHHLLRSGVARCHGYHHRIQGYHCRGIPCSDLHLRYYRSYPPALLLSERL